MKKGLRGTFGSVDAAEVAKSTRAGKGKQVPQAETQISLDGVDLSHIDDDELAQ